MIKKKIHNLISCLLLFLAIGIKTTQPIYATTHTDAIIQTEVDNYQSFKQSLLDVSITDITLTKNISLENTLPLTIANRSLTIHGAGYTLIESNAWLEVPENMTLTLANLKLIGQTDYGVFAQTKPTRLGATIIYQDCEYQGPQMVYNPNGKTIFKGDNKAILQDDMQEIGEVSQLEFEKNSSFDVRTAVSNTTRQYSAFWFRGAETNCHITIAENASITIDYPQAFALFYQYNDKELKLEKNATLIAATQNILYGSYGFRKLELAQHAQFKFSASGTTGTLTLFGDSILHDMATLDIMVGGDKAPITMQDNANFEIGKQAVLKLGRTTGTGIFNADNKDYNINIPNRAKIASQQGQHRLIWHDVVADISYHSGVTHVTSDTITIAGYLDLKQSSQLEITAPNMNDIKEQTQYLTYEKGVSKTKMAFHQDVLACIADTHTILTSNYDETWIQTIGQYQSIVQVENQSTTETYFIVVEITVVDTIPPVISVNDQVEQYGMTYFMPVVKTESAFLQDIVAVTDDGSPITSNFNDVAAQSTAGEYRVTLYATDASGNQAIPKDVLVFIESTDEVTNYLIQATDFSLHATTLQTAIAENRLNELLLESSQARLIDTNSNTVSYQNLQTTVTEDITFSASNEHYYNISKTTNAGLKELEKQTTNNNTVDEVIYKIPITKQLKDHFKTARPLSKLLVLCTLLIVIVAYFVFRKEKR